MEVEYLHAAIPLTYVLSGAANVLLVKWSDTLQGECSDGIWRAFQHPVLQTFLMFFGQFLCFAIYKFVYFLLQRRGDGSQHEHLITRGGREFSPLSLLLPAALDTIASLLLFTGLYLTYVSSFQMIRGAAIIFVGLFGSIYLSQPLTARHWMAIFTISCGVVTILSIDMQRSYYDIVSLNFTDENAILTGNLLVLLAQVFHAAQFVYEEKLLKGTDMPAMQAAGWQGIFGLAITSLLAIFTNFLPMPLPFGNNSRGVFDDFGDIFAQLRSNPWLCVALLGFAVSCTFYNFAALSIVKFSSSANRILADGLRVMTIWLVALLMDWEIFNLITFFAFLILEMGAIAYRNAIFLEWYRTVLAMARRRYAELHNDRDAAGAVPTTRPADII